ncbi:MAG: hypothetical protein IJC50_09325 [Clostridia bacterium]|nr:hypothetical protein [Clostridia bacterium]
MELAVKVEGFSVCSSALRNCESVIGNVRTLLLRTQNSLDYRFLRNCGAASQLNSIYERLGAEKSGIRRMQNALESIDGEYRRTENSNKKIFGDLSGVFESDKGGETIVTPETESSSGWGADEWDNVWDLVEKGGVVGSFIATIGSIITGGVSDFGDGAKVVKNIIGFAGEVADSIPKSDASFDWKTLFGFNSKELSVSDIFDGYKIDSSKTGAENFSAVAKWAGIALSAIIEGYENFTDEENEGWRKWGETIGETAVGVGLSIGASVLVTAGLSAVGIASAPALVVGALGAGVVIAVNETCEWRTGKDFGEFVSDAVLDAGEAIVEGAGKVIDNIADGAKALGDKAKQAGEAVCNWFGEVFSF